MGSFQHTAPTPSKQQQQQQQREQHRSQKSNNRRLLCPAALILLLSASSAVDGFSPISVRLLTTSSSSSSPWWGQNAQGQTQQGADRFFGRRRTESSLGSQKSNNDDSSLLSFSRRKESPLGVRRRVKAVLEKAKSRTGINNTSTDENINGNTSMLKTKQTALDVVAEAASIGGLGAVLVDDKTGAVDVALEYNTNKNGKSLNGRAQGTSSSAMAFSSTDDDDDFEDEFVLRVTPPATTKSSTTTTSKRTTTSSRANGDVDAIRSDTPAAYTETLPFTLPTLTKFQKQQLMAGERLQEQEKMGREGSGYVVVDVKAPPYVVWECLLDFESYPTIIPTVRDVRFFSSQNLKSGYYSEQPMDPATGRELRRYGTPSTTRAAFILSKFRLNIAAIHNYRPHPKGHYMVFTLDPECTNVVLKSAKGIWYTQKNPDGRGEEWTRVWLICELGVSPLLPKFIVDYAAKRAMPRASTWLKPQVETAAKLWLKNRPNHSK